MAALVLGPLLRYVDGTDATLWVETDCACEVEILGHRARTFQAEGHHYALVRITGLTPGATLAYSVQLDGEPAWPEPGSEFPPSVIRTPADNSPFRFAFGSCRVAMPHHPPYTLTSEEDERGFEIDALYALSYRMRHQPPAEWPHALFLAGDQIYADEVSLGTRAFIRARRDVTRAPGEEVADFEEYAHLYRDSWGQPEIRWLLANIPTTMIFDDHDVNDDWNISESWIRDMRAQPWWDERIASGFMSYWIYQHLGNLSPQQLARDELLQQVQAMDDAGPLLRERGLQADRQPGSFFWSFYRDFGRTRLLVMDSRAGRILDGEHREMLSEAEWNWIVERTRGDFNHLLLGTSLPIFLGPGLHYLEAWNEAVCDGRWGRWAARRSEKLRRKLDLEHWAAFEDSFRQITQLLCAIGSGQNAPATIAILSGDVHNSYVARVSPSRGQALDSRVYQIVCSPFRNPLDAKQRRAMRAAWSRAIAAITRSLAQLAGVRRPDVTWRLVGNGPWFDNHVSMLEIDGPRVLFRIEKAPPGDHEHPRLEVIFERPLADDEPASALD